MEIQSLFFQPNYSYHLAGVIQEINITSAILWSI